MPFSTARNVLAGLALPLALASLGCDHDDHDGDGDSVVRGTVVQASFPREVLQVTVHEVNGGALTTADVDADGSFAAALADGGTYRLLLSPGGDRWPITLRSGLGRLDTTVFVATGRATADIGEIRFWPGGTAGRAALVGAEDAEPALCTDGALATGEPCAIGEAAVRCGDHKRGKGHRKHDHHDHDDDDGDREASECQNGLDAQGQACHGGPTGFDASAFEPQAIPTANLPDVLACNDDDDDDHDDDDHDEHGEDD